MKKKRICFCVQQCIIILMTLQLSFSPSRADEVVIGDYTIRDSYIDHLSEIWVEIFHRDKRVHHHSMSAYLAQVRVEGGMVRNTDGELLPLPLGEDLTGDGIPDVVIVETGRPDSARYEVCVMHLVELGECFRYIATFSNSICGHFEDFDHDGRFEVSLFDETFADWEGHWLWSDGHRGSVILRYDEQLDRYSIAEDLMFRPDLSEDELERIVATVREARNDSVEDEPPTILWDMMLDLIYSGQEAAAWQLYNRVWQPHFGDQAAMAASFKAQLAQSEYWEHLSPLKEPEFEPVGYPELLHRPSVPPSGTLPIRPAYEAQCGTIVACDAETCTTSFNGLNLDEFWFHFAETATAPVQMMIIVSEEGKSRVYNKIGTYDELCSVGSPYCGSQLDAPCDRGTPVFLIHRSSQHRK